MNTPRLKHIFLLLFVLVTAVFLGTISTAGAATTDLIISEYGEGSGFNKYIEIYNGTGASVDLSDYEVWRISNGGNWPEATIPLSGTLNDGEVLIVYNPGNSTTPVSPVISSAGDLQISSGNLSHNGDDAIGLAKNSTLIDAVGEDGADPGSGWDVAGTTNATADHVIVRKDTVCSPNTNWTASRGTNTTDSEWIVLNNEDWSNIGIHTASCNGGADTAPSVASTSPTLGETGVAVNTNIDINFSEAVNVAGNWFDVTCVNSGNHAAVVTGGTQNYTLNPDVDFANSEVCTLTVNAANVTDIDGTPDNMAANHIISFTTSTLAAPSLVINEINADPDSTNGDANGDGTAHFGDDEFVEIYNDSGVDIDVSGWTLSDGFGVRHTFPANSIVPNQCAILVFGGGTPTGSFGGAVVQTASSGTLGLNNGGDTVTLNDGGQDQATAGYGSAGGNNQSLTLDPDITGATFVQHTGATGSGGALFSPGTMIDGTQFAGCPISAFINEVRINKTSTEADFFEIQGAAGTSLDSLTYLVLSGEYEPGSVDFAISLAGMSIPADGFFVAGGANTASTYGITPDLSVEFDFFGSPSTHMIVANYTGTDADDYDTNNDGVLDSTPWSYVADSVSLIDGDGNTDYSYSSVVVGPDGNFTPAGTYRCDDAPAGTFDNNQLDFGSANGTPGESNALLCLPIPTDLKIHDIQGTGLNVTNPGELVRVEAVVVADHQGSNELRGFFIQEEDSDVDADSMSSEGIFVYCGGCSVAVSEGDLVEVVGIAEDFFSMSQIDIPEAGLAGGVSVVSSGNMGLVTPASVDLPAPASTTAEGTFEQLEGMLVTFVDELTVTEYFQLARFGQIVLSEGGKLRQYTNDNLPSAAGYSAHLADIAARQIILDDLNNAQNIDPVYHPQPNGFSTTDYVRGGDTVTNLTGVMHWSYPGSGANTWRIRPQVTNPVSFTHSNPRQAAPDDVGGNVKVATLNVLNYFTTIDLTSDNNSGDCGPSGTMDCRGADSAAELQRQTDKLVAALNGMDADIVGLVELENNATASLQAIVDALNVVSAKNYAYVNTGTIGDDAIKVGIIYNADVVSPSGAYAILDSNDFIDPNNTGSPRNRPALAQTFEVTNLANASFGAKFTVVVNHLKSKGSGCGAGDDDTTTGQGNCNLTRTLAAQRLVDWLATDPTSSNDPDMIILGDINSYAMEDPIQAIIAGSDDTAGTTDDFTNLINLFGGPSAYSYVFSAQWGYLDHGLANAPLTTQVTGATEWHINADEVNLLDYNDEIQDAGEASFEAKPSTTTLYAPDPYRVSDHDPLIVGLNASPYILNGDGCIVIALEGSPFDGFATVVEANNGRFDARDWKHEHGLPVDTCFEIHGTNSNDRIYGAYADDTIFGYDGNDKLYGRDGNDALYGGPGNDYLNGNLGDFDRMYGDDGNDRLIDGDGVIAAHGGNNNDTLVITLRYGWLSPDGQFTFDGITAGYGNDTVRLTLKDQTGHYFVTISGDEYDVPPSPDEGNDVLNLRGHITPDSEFIKFERTNIR